MFNLSCEEYENPIYTNSAGFIQLESVATINVVESSPDDIEINYILDGPKSEAVNVEVMVTSDDDSRYEVVSGTSLTIMPGETSVTFTMRPVNNFDTDGNIDVSVTLTESSSLPIGIGGENANNVTRIVTIADDDCPFDINDWVGTFDVDEVITGGPNTGLPLAVAFGETYLMDFALDPTDMTGSKIVMTNLGNEFLPDGTVFTFLSCDGIVTMTPETEVVALFTTWSIDTSSYNEADFSITAEGPLGASRTYEMIFTKQ
ncbi:hypothetical protein GCM10011444_00020 [Winogradskyella haliclonae]|uniref:Calx-beta domain-containing protein n=2 Tax=Winogradskyella haliclonae TaxID=2048558 RepID=A0ABQ2BVD2_9FLAO|nr:hypothetical protein GCM10011444_00020 [Winogradskyella haliclonae]